MKKHLPNIISAARIPMALGILFTVPLSLQFYLLYALCGISDALDGYLARKLKVTSTLGAKLDSAADLLLTAVLIIELFPMVQPSVGMLIWLGSIALIRVLSAYILYRKHKTVGLLHTYANKFTGLLLFAFPFLLALVPTNALLIGMCLVATISATEELIINCTAHSLDLNRKGLLSLNSDRSKAR